MPHLENFSFYSNKLDSGDIVTNDKTFIDDKGSFKLFVTSIYNIYDKPYYDNSRELLGQTVWNGQLINKEPVKNGYGLSNETFFFKNGSLNVEWNTLNWVPGTPIVTTIIYGTGEYLGATGFIQYDVTDVQYDPCKDADLLTRQCNVIFTN